MIKLIKLILWYLKRKGYNYTLQDKSHTYINYPTAKFGMESPKEKLHVSTMTPEEQKELHNYMEDNPR